ncbi:hypothetical protein Tco_0588270 [Tanacetum coccineum]
MSSRVSNRTVNTTEPPRNQKTFLKSKDLTCPTCKKYIYSANHDECILKYLSKIPIGQRFSPNKSSNVYLKTTPPRSGLTWKPTGRIFTQVGLKWIPIRKSVETRYNTNNSASPLGKETHNPKTVICANSSSLSAGTSMAFEPISSKGSSNMNEYKRIMPAKIDLTLEQSQQGVSNDVLVSIEGVEELKRNMNSDIEDDIMDPMMQCTTLPSHSGFSQQKLVSFVMEITDFLIDFSHPEVIIGSDTLGTLSWRNKIGMHTSKDDYLNNTLRFVSAKEETQIYDAILPESLTTTPPKKARKFKKPASPKLTTIPFSTEEPTGKSKRVKRPAKKSTKAPARGVVIRETPEMPLSKKKEKVDVTRGKGIELLSQVALTEDAQFEEVRTKSMRDFHKTHPSRSGTVKTTPSAAKIKPFGNDEDDSNNEQDSSGEDSDQKNDNDDDKTQSDNENESDSKHETNENESSLESDQEENEKDEDDEEEVKYELVKTPVVQTHPAVER